MSGKTDQAKGHVKEAVGDLTDNESLKREGQKDQAAGKVKETADKAKKKFDDVVDDVKERLD